MNIDPQKIPGFDQLLKKYKEAGGKVGAGPPMVVTFDGKSVKRYTAKTLNTNIINKILKEDITPIVGTRDLWCARKHLTSAEKKSKECMEKVFRNDQDNLRYESHYLIAELIEAEDHLCQVSQELIKKVGNIVDKIRQLRLRHPDHPQWLNQLKM